MNLLNVHCSDHRPVTHYCFLEVVWQNAGAELKGNLLRDQSCHYNYHRLTDYQNMEVSSVIAAAVVIGTIINTHINNSKSGWWLLPGKVRRGSRALSHYLLTAPYETGTHFTDGELRLRDVKPLAHGHIVAKAELGLKLKVF